MKDGIRNRNDTKCITYFQKNHYFLSWMFSHTTPKTKQKKGFMFQLKTFMFLNSKFVLKMDI